MWDAAAAAAETLPCLPWGMLSWPRRGGRRGLGRESTVAADRILLCLRRGRRRGLRDNAGSGRSEDAAVAAAGNAATTAHRDAAVAVAAALMRTLPWRSLACFRAPNGDAGVAVAGRLPLRQRGDCRGGGRGAAVAVGRLLWPQQ